MSSYAQMYKKYLDVGDSLNREEDYMKKFEEVMYDFRSGPINKGPVEFMDDVFCGSKEDARDADVLRRLRITNVLNCAGKSVSHHYNPYIDMNCDIKSYLELEADDNERFPIIRLFYTQAKAFLDNARMNGDKTMVHCELGMNRSVTLCLAYKLDTNKCNLFKAVKDFVVVRPNILTNRGFRRQLVHFATDHQSI